MTMAMTIPASLRCDRMRCDAMPRFLDMTGFPGGLTAWAPALLTVLVCSWVAYRGQVRSFLLCT